MELNYPIIINHTEADNYINLTYEEDKTLKVVMNIEGRKAVCTFDNVTNEDFDMLCCRISDYIKQYGYSFQTRGLILRAFLWT